MTERQTMDIHNATDGEVEAGYFFKTPAGRPVLLLDMRAGPKRFRRIWLDEWDSTKAIEWTWVGPPANAVRLR